MKMNGKWPINHFCIFILILSLCSSCVQDGGKGRGGKTSSNLNSKTGGSEANQNPSSNQGNGANAGQDSILTGQSFLNMTPLTELRHFIDPYTGHYKTKITIPKNYSGFLYISGLNITSLNENVVSVRFNFGREKEPVVVPATIGRTTGITPQTDIQVLIMDMRDKPFQDIRLLYDLFDYNNYGSGETPTNDPKNVNLYCRGLNLEDDHTFESSATVTTCENSGQKCLYAYAKIRDSGLYSPTGNAQIPTDPLIDLTGSDFSTSETAASAISSKTTNNLKKCLPDNGRVYFKHLNSYNQITYIPNSADVAGLNVNVLSVGEGDSKTEYSFRGPYRPISKSQWVMKASAAINPTITGEPTGLFASSLDGTVEKGILSYLFPRAGKLSLDVAVEYLGSDFPLYSTPFSQNREKLTLTTAGESKWMDGCSVRVSQFDEFTGEGISSCNITATVEIITTDLETGKEKILASARNLKLQLIRPSATDHLGREVLYQSMRACSTSRSCGKDECCFNERCWSKELVSQCIEDSGSDGNLQIGDACTSDYQCSSLCCDRSKGRCSPHNTLLEPAVLCSKPPGDQCVTRDWCRQDIVRECLVIKTGVAPDGKPTCAMRCYNRLEHGNCTNGICVAPRNPDVPIFDPVNPDCSQAIDPPTTF